MLLFILAFLGGILTILSPCILPVLPFVFTRAGEPFRRSGLPLLIGMAVTFAAVASLAAVGGGWIVSANQWGRWIALALVLLFGLTLILPSLADRLSRPFVALGNKLSNSAARHEGSPGSSLLPAICTSCWARAPTANRCDSACVWTAGRRATIMAPTSARTARASWNNSDSIN